MPRAGYPSSQSADDCAACLRAGDQMNREKEYDGIVIGAGHNGMILQGYLLKAGFSVAIVEQH